MGSKLQEYRNVIEAKLHDKSAPWTSYFEQVEAKTGVNRIYIFCGLVAFTGLYLVFGFGAELICNLIGFCYPAYMSMKALESPQKDDDTKWLTYWVVFACFSLVEYFSDFIVGWFPLYWLAKCLFIIWCYIPGDLNGSLILYRRIIRPYYQKHHDRIDNLANSVNNISLMVVACVILPWYPYGRVRMPPHLFVSDAVPSFRWKKYRVLIDLKHLMKDISRQIDKTIDKGIKVVNKKIERLHQD